MARGAFANALTNLDHFSVVSRDLTRGTLTGGVFTAMAYALLPLLLVAELGAFLRTTYQTNIVMDQNEDKNMEINFDITLFDLPCNYLQVFVWDKFGGEKIDAKITMKYMPIDQRGKFAAVGYTKEEIATLEKLDSATDVSAADMKELDSDWSSSSDHFKHSDFDAVVTFHDFTLVNFFAEWCVHCRQFAATWNQATEKISEKMKFDDADGISTTVKMMKINCVDFGSSCQQAVIPAFPTLRLYKKDGSFEVYHMKRTMDNIVSFLTSTIKNSHMMLARHHNIFTEGCRVQGTLFVNRAPGHFHVQANAFGRVSVNPALANVSHAVNHLSFGKKSAKNWAERQNIPADMVTHISPLDGKTFNVYRFHEAPQHYLKVVSTRVEGKIGVFYQMTHTDRTSKYGKNATPHARFTYDFSPVSVVVRPKSKRWYEFLTSLFAILGGTYTVVELCSGAVDTVSTAVKKAIGKDS